MEITRKQIVVSGLYRAGVMHALKHCSHRYEVVSTGGSRKLRRATGAKYVILAYHTVGNKAAPWYCHISAATFRKQMEYVAKHFRVISLEQMIRELEVDGDREQGIVVTFDDGYLGTFTEAFPILQQYEIPATVYLAAGAINSGELLWYDRMFQCFQAAPPNLTLHLSTTRQFRLDSPESRITAAEQLVMYLRSLPNDQRKAWCEQVERVVPLTKSMLGSAMMSWSQVRRMHEAGIQFGAHTMTHPVISRLDVETMKGEIAASRAMIEEHLEVPVEHFAFPFGKSRDCGTRAANVLKELEFRSAVTSITGLNRPGADCLRLRRIVVGHHPSTATFAAQLHMMFFLPVDEEAELYTEEHQDIETSCAIT